MTTGPSSRTQDSSNDLDIVAGKNEDRFNRLAQEIRSKSQRRDVNHSRRTLIGQITSGLISMVLGGLLIGLCIILGDELKVPYLGRNDPFEVAIAGSIGLVILVIYTIQKQYYEALTPLEAFGASFRYTFYVWVCVVLLNGSILLLNHLSRAHYAYSTRIIEESVSYAGTFGSIAVAIGGTQYFRLKIEGFDAAKHLKLLSNENAIEACELGNLPYRIVILAFWEAFFAGLFSIFTLGISITALLMDGIPKLLTLPMFIFVPMPIVVAMPYVLFFYSPHLKFVDAYVIEKSIDKTRKGTKTYYVRVSYKTFRTDSETWKSVKNGYKYRLWYAPINNFVVAAELQSTMPGETEHDFIWN